MAMKKIKPQYGKVVAPIVDVQDIVGIKVEKAEELVEEKIISEGNSEEKTTLPINSIETESENIDVKSISSITSDPNPFLQTKEIFAKAQLTKIGYRMRSDYVEILDIIKKLKKGGYTLEAVLDDALTYYFNNSEDGQQAIKKAEIFYS
jgi:hypothetical protein